MHTTSFNTLGVEHPRFEQRFSQRSYIDGTYLPYAQISTSLPSDASMKRSSTGPRTFVK